MNENHKSAILELIDIKINNDMEKVLNSINTLKLEIATMEVSNRAQFEAINTKFGAIDHKIDGQTHKIDGVQKIVYGVLVAILIALASQIFILTK